MNTITNALVGEHSAFLTVFNQIERLLPRLNRLDEVKMLAELVEGSLLEHASKEDNLVSVKLEHLPEDRGVVGSLHQDHHEIDHLLALIKSADGVATGRQFLKAVLAASRKHFQWEEKLLFPLIEETRKLETLCGK
jgi:iron-sulfur cluster repair protein YtfE (RIC family)